MNAAIDARRWPEIVGAFEEIVELTEPLREERLAAIGATDPDLRRGVEALVRADGTADSTLEELELALASPAFADVESDYDADPLNIVGRDISHFHVIASLAYGGMGVVYRAEDTQLRRAIALKFPLPGHQFDRHSKERFLHEARVAGALDHANLCTVYEAGETVDGQLFLAMPLYDGETLKARLARAGALPIDTALNIARQIAHGLSAAHRAGIIHRDLKPANMMLLPDGAVKILDFGLAKASDLTLTATRTRLGTVSYMAPEQIHGQPVDQRTDLWALGVMLFEMLTGRRPFEGGHDVSVAHAIVHSEPVRSSALRGEIRPELDDIVRTLLCKDPQGRCLSADEVSSALVAIQLGHAMPRRTKAQPAWFDWRTARTRSRIAVLAFAVVVTIAAGAWLVRRNGATAPSRPHMLVVLAFDDLSNPDEGRYLARGLGDALTTHLSKLGTVVVPNYLSLLDSSAAAGVLPQITNDGGVTAVLRGSVARVGETIRVDAKLVAANSGKSLWTQRYERPAVELLDIQRDIMRASVAALRVRLTDAERTLLETPPTRNARAYELYLQGREMELRGAPRDLLAGALPTENVRRAQSLYARARELDPDFALARARLAIMHTLSSAYDTTEARLEQARLEAETALRLQPGMPEAHEALAYYWAARRDMPKAIDELRLALSTFPNNAALHMTLGRRFVEMGQWEEAIDAFSRAVQIDPSNPNAEFAAALYLLRLRRVDEAIRAFDRALALRPDYHMVKIIRGQVYLRNKGVPDTLAVTVRTIPRDWDQDGMATFAHFSALRAQRRYTEAVAMLDEPRPALSRDGLVYHPLALMRAQIFDDMGDRANAQQHYDQAAAVLADSVAVYPANASIRVSLALAYAGLGRNEEAKREARRAIGSVPLARNNTGATAFMGGAVEVFALAGDIDAALELLELLFTMPAGREVMVPYLRLWPGFDPLRSDPRFEELLERFSS